VEEGLRSLHYVLAYAQNIAVIYIYIYIYIFVLSRRKHLFQSGGYGAANKFTRNFARVNFDCFVILLAWLIWKGFQHNVMQLAADLVDLIREQGRNWVAAGFSFVVGFLTVIAYSVL
jgi:hypothetical protein